MREGESSEGCWRPSGASAQAALDEGKTKPIKVTEGRPKVDHAMTLSRRHQTDRYTVVLDSRHFRLALRRRVARLLFPRCLRLSQRVLLSRQHRCTALGAHPVDVEIVLKRAREVKTWVGLRDGCSGACVSTKPTPTYSRICFRRSPAPSAKSVIQLFARATLLASSVTARLRCVWRADRVE